MHHPSSTTQLLGVEQQYPLGVTADSMPDHAESNGSADALVDVEEPLLIGSDDPFEKEGHCQHRSGPLGPSQPCK